MGGEGHWFVWVYFGHLSAKTSISVVQEYSWLGFPWLNPSFYLSQLRAGLELSSLLLFLLSFKEEGGQAEGFLLGMAASACRISAGFPAPAQCKCLYLGADFPCSSRPVSLKCLVTKSSGDPRNKKGKTRRGFCRRESKSLIFFSIGQL